VIRKWEANRGMDPFSFGYNYQTPDSGYLTGANIITSLVDIVSKNGNFLLDIGPKNDGTIPQIMQTGLSNAGAWLKTHSEGIMGTRFWYTTSGTGQFRYTTKPTAFYIHLITQPAIGNLRVPDKVPYLPGDAVTVLGGKLDGTAVPVTCNSDGTITLAISSAMVAADQYVWTFKITYAKATMTTTISTMSSSLSTASPPSSTTLATTTTATTTPGGGCASPRWGQCGGIGYTGCTTCEAGTSCQSQNPYYSQCL
jgi:hypothetical protein